jgi:hypothetical protein
MTRPAISWFAAAVFVCACTPVQDPTSEPAEPTPTLPLGEVPEAMGTATSDATWDEPAAPEASPERPEATPASATDPTGASQPTCYATRAAPSYQDFGWTHYVDVLNRCEEAIACDVASTVDPEPKYRVVVQPEKVSRVRVRYGSNTKVYSAIVACWYQR